MKKKIAFIMAMALCTTALMAGCGKKPETPEDLHAAADTLEQIADSLDKGDNKVKASGEIENGFKWEIKGDTLTVTGSGDMPDYNGQSYREIPWNKVEDAEIRNLVVGDGITKIGDYAFAQFNKLKTVTLPNGLKVIGKHAFEDSYDLKECEIPDTVVEIQESAFEGSDFCNETFNIPGSVKTIGDRAFISCDFSELNIGEGVETIGEDAFSYCERLSAIKLPNSVKTLGSHAFTDCKHVTEIELPSSLEVIPKYCFNNCNSLRKIVFPEGLKEISYGAFCTCKNLTDVTFSSTITVIDDSAFSWCKINDLKFPPNLEEIGQEAFKSCELETVILPESVVDCGGAFNVNTLKKLVIPNPDCRLYVYAFKNETVIYSVPGGKTEANAKEFRYVFEDIANFVEDAPVAETTAPEETTTAAEETTTTAGEETTTTTAAE